MNILNMENFLDTVNACIVKSIYSSSPNGKKQNIKWRRKDTGQFVAAILPKQKLSAAYFRNSESNGLYEYYFRTMRGIADLSVNILL